MGSCLSIIFKRKSNKQLPFEENIISITKNPENDKLTKQQQSQEHSGIVKLSPQHLFIVQVDLPAKINSLPRDAENTPKKEFDPPVIEIKESQHEMNKADKSLIKTISLKNQAVLEDIMEGNEDDYFDGEEFKFSQLNKIQTVSFDHETIKWKPSEKIGQGSYGTVIMGMNKVTGQMIAVKQVELIDHQREKDAEKIQSLEIEIDLLRCLKHKNIVSYYGCESTEKHMNIFLEYVAGGSLYSMLRKFGKFKESLVRVYMRQILQGLIYLHDHGVFHRDIKPGNILVDANGICKLADFGSSKKLTYITRQDINRSIQGTPNYMAPEIVQQVKSGRKADIWSLGCTMIELLNGRPPWSEMENAIMIMVKLSRLTEPPPLPEEISEDAKDFLQHCLQNYQKEQIQSKDGLLEDQVIILSQIIKRLVPKSIYSLYKIINRPKLKTSLKKKSDHQVQRLDTSSKRKSLGKPKNSSLTNEALSQNKKKNDQPFFNFDSEVMPKNKLKTVESQSQMIVVARKQSSNSQNSNQENQNNQAEEQIIIAEFESKQNEINQECIDVDPIVEQIVEIDQQQSIEDESFRFSQTFNPFKKENNEEKKFEIQQIVQEQEREFKRNVTLGEVRSIEIEKESFRLFSESLISIQNQKTKVEELKIEINDYMEDEKVPEEIHEVKSDENQQNIEYDKDSFQLFSQSAVQSVHLNKMNQRNMIENDGTDQLKHEKLEEVKFFEP